MVRCITEQKSILKQIENGELSIVTTLSNAVGYVSKLSFASKFCTYIARYQFNSDAYSIYDNVIQSVLPYYIFKYYDKKTAYKFVGRKNSTLGYNNHKDEQYYYETYNNLIGYLLTSINTKHGLIVSREQLDTVLWYYYKGDTELVNKAISKVIEEKYQYN